MSTSPQASPRGLLGRQDEFMSPFSSPTKNEFKMRELQCINAEITAELLLAQSVNNIPCYY
jgi:hypothetical protein